MLRATLVAAILGLGGSPAPARVPLPPQYQIVHADCPAYEDGGSCWDVTTRTIYLARYASRRDRFHELGHAFDSEVLTDPQRTAFVRIMDLQFPWVQGTGWDAGANYSPNEWFADAYADCELWRPPKWNSRAKVRVGTTDDVYGYTPTRAQRRQVCTLIRSAG